MELKNLSFKNIIVATVGFLTVVTLPIVGTNLWETLDARYIMVIQSPLDGTLTVHTTAGLKWQGGGKVTTYPRRQELTFICPAVEKVKDKEGNITTISSARDLDTSLRVRFKEGGHASLCGAISWEMPLDPPNIVAIHQKFGSTEGIETQAVKKMMDAAVYMSGPLMSSTESSGGRRAELVQFINDQARNGVYVTSVTQSTTIDPLTKLEHIESTTQILRDDKGMPKRQQGSTIGEFSINLLPLSISEIRYDDVVEQQIADRQKATTRVQISLANAIAAQQDAITTEATGKANAAKAKWEQEIIKAKEVVIAQQQLEVATLKAQEAQQYKVEQELRGAGEAARKRLVMEADGALDPKLNAAIEINKMYADAIAKAQPGAWSPQFVFGGNGQQTGSAATSLVDLLTAKTAKDLALDMSLTGKSATQK